MVANQSSPHQPLPPIGANPPSLSPQTLPRPPAHRNHPIATSAIEPDLEAQRTTLPALPPQPLVRMPQHAPPPPPTAPLRAPPSPLSHPPPPAQDVSDLRQQLDDLRQLVRDVVLQNGALLARMQPPPASAQPSEFSAHSDTSGYDAHPPPAPAAPPPPPEHPPVQQPAPADPPRFDRADLKRLSTSLEPSRINRWISNFIDTVQDYNKQAATLLRMPTADARIATAHDEHLQSLDRWAARQALNTMDHTQPYVRLLFNSSSTDADEARRSGVALLEFVRQRSQIVNAESARLLISQFDEKVYFTSAMDAPSFHLQADELRADFDTLPADRTSASNALLRSLLAKLPASIKQYTNQLEVELLKAELMKAPAPWTYDQLVLLASQFTLLAARQAAPGASVNAAERKPKKDKPPSSQNNSRPCPCCGKTGHSARDCPTSCPTCRNRSCPGNYGAPCVVRSPTKPTVVHNAQGKPVPPNVLRILVKAHSSDGVVATATSQTSTNTCTSNFAGDYWGATEQAAQTNMLHAQHPPSQHSPTQNQWECDTIAAETAEAWLNDWRAAEVAASGNRNITLPLCHGTRELQQHETAGGRVCRLLLSSNGAQVGLISAILHTSRRLSIVRVSQIYVIPQYRRRGGAQALLRSLLLLAQESDTRFLALGLGLREQQSTITFWTRYGFAIDKSTRLRPSIADTLLPIPPILDRVSKAPPSPTCSHIDASQRPPTSTQHLVMLDGGSNINLFSHPDVPRHGTPLPSSPLNVSGWHTSAAMPVNAFYKIGLEIRSSSGNLVTFNVNVAYAPDSRRDILSESAMWDTHTWKTSKEPDMQVTAPSAIFPLRRDNGVYFLQARIVHAASASDESPTEEYAPDRELSRRP